MLIVVAVFIITTGSLQNCLFIIIIFINSGIGIATELKAKIVLDNLSIMTRQTYKIIRDDNTSDTLSADDIEVLDYIEITSGMQIPVDGTLVQGKISVNESMLTGESNTIYKAEGEELLSGTAVVSGAGIMRANCTKMDSYVTKLSAEAKVFKVAKSDIQDGVNKILKFISVFSPIVAILLIITGISNSDGNAIAPRTDEWNDLILSTAGGIIGMIPEGLVLLTSLNFAIAAILLASKNVFVTELNSVETLARVDELILDKTGTITDGMVMVECLESVSEVDPIDYFALTQIVSLPGGTPTSDAIRQYIKDGKHKTDTNKSDIEPSKSLEIIETMPFDSAKKYSAITVRCDGVSDTFYQLGAPEFLSVDANDIALVNEYQKNGKRVLSLVKNGKMILFIVCGEHIRETIIPIIEYMKSSNINIRIVSGDNEETVQAIASQIGIENVVGRAKPETKLDIVKQLQSEGKVVAMTGDGVNDMLALKEADLGIAMGNASGASKAVANLVLVDSEFSRLPDVIAQGRRVIANIERVASLFLVKTFYSVGLSLSTIILGVEYPFLPIHLTLISSLFIGIPAFFLALPPNNTPYRKGFLKRVMKFSLPFSAFVVAVETVLMIIFPLESPLQVWLLLSLGFISFVVVCLRARPLFSWRGLMVLLLLGAFIACFFVPFLSNLFLIYP